MAEHYILDPDALKPVPADLMTWAWWFADAGELRQVARTKVGDLEVSTVFIGLDHWGKGPPLLYETMVFGPGGDGCDERRWHMRAEALEGHKAVVKELNDAR